ncbi:hypothetical protein VTH06DRAFT_1441 [Thermothelomyces fergusii]
MTQAQSRFLYHQQPHQQQLLPAAAAAAAAAASVFDDPALHTASPLEASKLGALDFDIDLDADFDPAHLHYNSLSSSPVSTQSLLSQYSPLSAFDSIPTPTLAEPSLFAPLRQSGLAAPESSAPPLFPSGGDAMQADMWMQNGQITPRSVGRFSHQRDSSRSSMGSNGPASPFSQNTVNPQIAMTDFGDGFHGLQGAEDLHHYQLSAKQHPGVPPDNFYTALSHGAADHSGGVTPSYPYLSPALRCRTDRGLLPENTMGQAGSQPVSVASSAASDTPATQAGGESGEDRRRNHGETEPDPFEFLACTPRSPPPGSTTAMPTTYADELFQPQLLNSSAAAGTMAGRTTAAATAPTNAGQVSMSPASDLFSQRLQAANNQHLSAVTNSPVSSTSRDQSPFRHGSPLAPLPTGDFRSAMGTSQMGFNTAQQMREQTKAMRDAQAMRQQMARAADTSTPQTISPKDAMLEFREPEGDGNFPLFPRQSSTGFNAEAINKAAAAHSQQVFGGLPMDPNAFSSFLGTSMPGSMPPPPQQFPYLPHQRPQSAVPSVGNTSAATTRFGSTDTGATESAHGVTTPQRPADTSADGGTYTCTYHGCTLRFETPALLQKHKREGHRQAHGLGGARRGEAGGMTSSLLNTQAGPHRCDRINPSTGKPCNTVFSRPYDLTRHEHTIHNARKQKVRCDLCTDDKTFSRADALTRHYRVCHPDIDFPGKHRRRGGHSS